MEIFIGLIVWVCCMIFGTAAGSEKGIGGTAFILTFLFGPIGWLIVYFLQGNRRRCPYCQSLVAASAEVCPQCRRELELENRPLSDEEIRRRLDEGGRIEREIQRTQPEVLKQDLGKSGSTILDIPEQIRKLGELKSSGFITEDEFNSKKKELLDRL